MVFKNKMALNTDLNAMPTIRDNDFSFTWNTNIRFIRVWTVTNAI